MSTNISKQKREDLLNKIKVIRAFISAAPQDENTGNLLSYLSDLEKDVNGKKYGLVFEEHREEIDEVLDTHTPVLTENKDLFIDNGGQMNFLIEGDNLASLKLLVKEQNKHDLAKLMEQHRVDIEHLKEAHKLEMESKEQEHKNKLELQQKDFENSLLKQQKDNENAITAETLKGVFGMFGNALNTAMDTPEGKRLLNDSLKSSREDIEKG